VVDEKADNSDMTALGIILFHTIDLTRGIVCSNWNILDGGVTMTVAILMNNSAGDVNGRGD